MTSQSGQQSHLRDMDEESRRHHEAVLIRLGIRHWAEFDRDLVATLHEAQLATQTRDADYSLDGINIHCPAGVYHPSLGSSSTFMVRHLVGLSLGTPPSVLEIGVGSGAVLLSMARMYGSGRYVGVDISPLAIETARANAARNGIDADIRASDLFAAVQGERFDVILFNAPLYDREPRYAIEENMLCDPGGKILERFVRDVSSYLKPGGAAYVTASNIGLVAPLDNPRIAISLRGAELFEFGVIRTLVKIVPNSGC
jgi:methylase of polypeptide subunit release factors